MCIGTKVIVAKVIVVKVSVAKVIVAKVSMARFVAKVIVPNLWIQRLPIIDSSKDLLIALAVVFQLTPKIIQFLQGIGVNTVKSNILGQPRKYIDT
jgi:hypothetical protein